MYVLYIAHQKKVTEKEKIKPILLQEATTTIIDKSFCAKLKNGSKELVNKYLLCASGNGFLGQVDDDEATSNTTVDILPSTLVLTNDTEEINDSSELSSRKSSLLETCQVNTTFNRLNLNLKDVIVLIAKQ